MNVAKVVADAQNMSKKSSAVAGLYLLVLIAPLAAESRDEVAKIDKRLGELALIYEQEQAVINGFTKNRTVPVREGSKEYYACLNAGKRINLAQAEAAKLKEERKIVLAQAEVDSELKEAGTASEGGQGDGSGIVTVDWLKSDQFGFTGRNRVGVGSVVDSLKGENRPYSRELHGLKIKGLFVGMPYQQAKPIIEDLVKKAKAMTKRPDDELLAREVTKTSNGWEIGYCFLAKSAFNGVVMGSDGKEWIAHLAFDQEGIITEITYRAPLFEIKETSMEEFVKACEANFEIDLEYSSSTAAIGETIATETRYECKFPTGHKVEISLESSDRPGLTSIELGKTPLDESLRVKLTKELSQKDLKNQFDE